MQNESCVPGIPANCCLSLGLNVKYAYTKMSEEKSKYVESKKLEKHRKTVCLLQAHGFSNGRSGETRTLGLMLPKHARYQLRHTPI